MRNLKHKLDENKTPLHKSPTLVSTEEPQSVDPTTPNTPVDPHGSTDPFDPINLRLDQSFVEVAGVKKLLNTVPIRKPLKQDFVRVHPDPNYRTTAALIVLEEDREAYLLTPAMAQEMPGEFIMATLFTAINRQGVVFLWPVRLPAPDGRVLAWHTSMSDAAGIAQHNWVRVRANMSLGAYETFEATSPIPEPEWPDLPFKELIRIAFRDRLIDSIDHAVVRRLRGR